MPAEILNRLYDPFYTTKEIGKGTGLGMAVVKSIVEDHDGTISAKSQKDQGTTITIQLPLLDEVTHREPDKSCSLEKGTESILFVDDEQSLLKLNKVQL